MREKERPQGAQKLFLRALVGSKKEGKKVEEESDRVLLWEGFLELMREQRNDDNLSMEALKSAVKKEQLMVEEGEDRAQKRTNLDGEFKATMAQDKSMQLVKAKKIEEETAVLLGSTQNMAPEMMALWLARDGDAPPCRPEPPLFAPAAPKLGDPSGKDILGSDLALKLVELMLKNGTGPVVLEVCRGAWAMQALKEREAMKALKALEDKMVSSFLYY